MCENGKAIAERVIEQVTEELNWLIQQCNGLCERLQTILGDAEQELDPRPPVITTEIVRGSADYQDGNGPVPVDLKVETTTYYDGRIDKLVLVPTMGTVASPQS